VAPDCKTSCNLRETILVGWGKSLSGWLYERESDEEEEQGEGDAKELTPKGNEAVRHGMPETRAGHRGWSSSSGGYVGEVGDPELVGP
jgi:hypothetical protein